MNWSRHMMLTISAALLVVMAVAAAWAVESGFGTRADAQGLPLVALGSVPAATTQGSNSAPDMSETVHARMVMTQSLRMSSGPLESGPIKPGASGADGASTMMTSPTTGTHDTPEPEHTTMPTSGEHGDMSTGSAGTGAGSAGTGAGSGSTGTTMGTEPHTGTTAHMGSGMVNTTPPTSAQSSLPMTTATSPPDTTHTTSPSPFMTPTTTHMGGGGMGGTTGDYMGGTTTP